MRALGILVFFAVLLWLYTMADARAEGAHHVYHEGYYKGWVNQADQGCCDNKDCDELADADERTTGGKLEVRVENQWCEIKPRFYLKRGNVPNAAVSHVCVSPAIEGVTASPCDRLRCYQPRPGT